MPYAPSKQKARYVQGSFGGDFVQDQFHKSGCLNVFDLNASYLQRPDSRVRKSGRISRISSCPVRNVYKSPWSFCRNLSTSKDLSALAHPHPTFSLLYSAKMRFFSVFGTLALAAFAYATPLANPEPVSANDAQIAARGGCSSCKSLPDIIVDVTVQITPHVNYLSSSGFFSVLVSCF